MHPADAVRTHYDTLLGRNYLWMAGGMMVNTRRCRGLFERHAVVPMGQGTAIDLGAGCGFQSIPLAELGFRVTSVDFSPDMLGILAQQKGSLTITIVPSDILHFPSWSGKTPELIVCMGDTLPHLPDINAVRSLIRQCARELARGGRFIISLRDYSHEAPGTVAVMPVRRDADRIFLCRLEYSKNMVLVTDILYFRHSGRWMRSAGTYPKLRISPSILRESLAAAGFSIAADDKADGLHFLIAEKV